MTQKLDRTSALMAEAWRVLEGYYYGGCIYLLKHIE